MGNSLKKKYQYLTYEHKNALPAQSCNQDICWKKNIVLPMNKLYFNIIYVFHIQGAIFHVCAVMLI